jgi:CBS domain-containing protein
MYITSYLSKEVKPGKVNFKIEKLLKMVREFKLTHLPLFNGLDFVGNITEEDLEELAKEASKEDLANFSESFYLLEEHTIFDALQMMYLNHTNVLPILSKDYKYIGIVTEQSLVEALAKYPFVSEMAVSMVVSIASKDFSMSTISSIIESNNGKIYGIFVINQSDEKTEVLIRFNASSLVGIGEAFERYGYNVIQKFYNDEKQELLHSRYAQLLKYMNT